MAARIFGTCVSGSRSGTGGAFFVITCKGNAVIFWGRGEEVAITDAKNGIAKPNYERCVASSFASYGCALDPRSLHAAQWAVLESLGSQPRGFWHSN